MKKKLVAVAVAGICSIPLAAQAQTANVTLYGRLNLDFEVVNGAQPENGGNPNVARLSSNSSRFGMRGVESLGGGLNAIFQIESNVSADTGNSSTSGLASRETFVGFQGDWGTFKAGNFLNPVDDLHGIFGNAPTLLTSIFSTASLWGLDGFSRANGGFDTRDGNSLRYDSPSYSGLTYSVQGSTAENAQTHGYAITANMIYTNGPFQIGGDVASNQSFRGKNLNDNEYTFTGGYNFGPVRVAGVYEYIKYDTPTGGLNRDFWGVSGTVPAGPGSFYVFYGRALDGKGGAADGTTVGNIVKGPNTAGQMAEVSYTYPLSKRTAVYGGYVKIINQTNAVYTFNINSYAIAPGAKPGGVVLGMYHLF